MSATRTLKMRKRTKRTSKPGFGSLREEEWPELLSAPDPQLLDRLYVPALSRAVRHDRCCAYFSSRVLAAAARGFGGLIANLLQLGDEAPKPAVRLLVNEQLDAEDVRALLVGEDAPKLTAKLLKGLKRPAELLERQRLAIASALATRPRLLRCCRANRFAGR